MINLPWDEYFSDALVLEEGKDLLITFSTRKNKKLRHRNGSCPAQAHYFTVDLVNSDRVNLKHCKSEQCLPKIIIRKKVVLGSKDIAPNHIFSAATIAEKCFALHNLLRRALGELISGTEVDAIRGCRFCISC